MDQYFNFPGVDTLSERCRWAMLDGLLVERPASGAAKLLEPFLRLPREVVHIWTPNGSETSHLVSEIRPETDSLESWLTAGQLLRLSCACDSNLEVIPELSYEWMVDFEPKDRFQVIQFQEDPIRPRGSGSIYSIGHLCNRLQIAEALFSDEMLLVSAENIVASHQQHPFCMQCAFAPDHWKTHDDEEFPVWQHEATIVYLESAIVLAARAVEAIVGVPGNLDDPKKRHRVETRWRERTQIVPTDRFELSGKTYLKTYSDLRELRNSAAHSRGEHQYSLRREQAVCFQAFAWSVSDGRYRVLRKPLSQALDVLGVDEARMRELM